MNVAKTLIHIPSNNPSCSLLHSEDIELYSNEVGIDGKDVYS